MIEPVRYFVLMLRPLIVIVVLVVLLPASAVDAFLHLHDDPEHNHHEAATASEGILHTHLEGSPSGHDAPAAAAYSSERPDKLRFANLFRFVPAASFVPAICLETVQLVPALTCSSSRVVELVPSAHDPPSLDCSIPRSPPA
ncbi:MAG: hypothetical protein EHM18_08155 [Acidobacteria bacterium]|nr:MAG: hypothetical protein EHM18_08155 [Acidobacteriota bacterium]